MLIKYTNITIIEKVKSDITSMEIFFILGFVLIFSSSSIGENKGDRLIVSTGGSMDISQYERIIESTTSNFRTTGLILSLVGGFGFLISGYAIYKELD